MTGVAELLFGLAIIGSVTGVVVGFALYRAGKEPKVSEFQVEAAEAPGAVVELRRAG